MIMLKNRIGYGIVFLISVFLFVFYHNLFFFYIFLIVALLPVFSRFACAYVFRRTQVKAGMPMGAIGTENDIPVLFEIENSSALPMPGITLEYTVENGFYPNDEVHYVSLPLPRGKSSYGWKISSVYAGKVNLSGRKVSMRDYLGIFNFKRDWDETESVTVFPKESEIIMNIIEGLLTPGEDTQADTADTVEDVTQIKEFREYRPGDRMQKVNWKITAKRDELFVREFEKEFNRTVTLLVELRKDSDEPGFLDDLITAFYSSAVLLIDKEINFRVQWYDKDSDRFVSEIVDEPEVLSDVMSQMFASKSYDGYPAYEKYTQSQSNERDNAIYFTSPGFAPDEDKRILGTYKDKVSVICLF